MRTSAAFASLLAVLALAYGTERAPAAAPDGIHFEDVTAKAGLLDPLAGLLGHGGAWGDYDADGRIDLFAGGFMDRPDAEYAPASGPVANRLFRNEGDGRFAEVDMPGIGRPARTSGAVFVDLDNNGTLELYVANNAKQKKGRGGLVQQAAQVQRSQLFRNEAGILKETSTRSGAVPESLFTARNVGIFDYDGDALLDLLVLEDRFTDSPRSTLLRNLGGLKFSDASEAANLPPDIFGLGLAVADVNEDGRPDFFVGHSNRLFLSQPGNRYREAVELAPIFRHEPFDAEDWPCGAAFGDLNRDGRLDLVVSAHSVKARNRVFLHDGMKEGTPQFREITAPAGLAEVVPVRCPHVEIQDFDNDGWPDIYFSAAWMKDGNVMPLIYHHDGMKDGLPRFTPPRAVAMPMVYFPAGPSGDFDGDGRLDLFLINWFSGNHSRLLRNESRVKSWLSVRVKGRTFNSMGIGSRIELFAAGHSGERGQLLAAGEISTGYGYASGQPAVCHFGLGEARTVDVEIRLPNSTLLKKAGVNARQLLTVEEP